MSPPSIDEVPYLWHCDGSLRDIYILETNLVDWERFLSLVRAFPATYTFDGEVSLLPSASEIFRNREGHHILSIRVGAASVNCHFFIVDEIELDVDPREITAQSDHHALLAFVRHVALGLQKQALLTPENGEDTPFLTFDPAQDSWYVRG